MLADAIPTRYAQALFETAKHDRAMKTVADPLKIDPTAAAEAVFATVNATMADQIIEVSTKQGHDVRDCVMVVGGGGAGASKYKTTR